MYANFIRGGRTNTEGICPGCGSAVPRVHAWSTKESADVYACGSCGTFEYSTEGALFPSTVGTGMSLLAIGDRAATVQAVLDPVDCVQ